MAIRAGWIYRVGIRIVEVTVIASTLLTGSEPAMGQAVHMLKDIHTSAWPPVPILLHGMDGILYFNA